MDDFRISTQTIEFPSSENCTQAARLLETLGLDFNPDPERLVLVEEDGLVLATGSLAGNVLRCIGVQPEREGEGFADRAVSRLLSEAASLGRDPLFVYTKPNNEYLFSRMGFSLLASSGADAIVMERATDRMHGIDAWLADCIASIPGGKADAALVVNANPFTLGHRYLVEKAAAAARTLIVFVLSGDNSTFPGTVREKLVREGCADLHNVVVAGGGNYCISGATFPSYYIKEKSRLTEIQARLDLDLFARRIAPALGIKRRFVGTEPYCKVTSTYNSVMAEIFPRHGLELIVIPRLESAGSPVSASAVRAALAKGDIEKASTMVPETTSRWFRSREAGAVLQKMAAPGGLSRH